MKQLGLEERVAALEQQMAQIHAGGNGITSGDWRSTVGMFTGDDVMRQIDEAARKIRAADRRRAQASSSSKGRKKK